MSNLDMQGIKAMDQQRLSMEINLTSNFSNLVATECPWSNFTRSEVTSLAVKSCDSYDAC